MSKGSYLNKKWGVNAKHALYRSTGDWYHVLRQFPGAYFDDNGYILFRSEQEYRSCKYFNITKEVFIGGGISQIPGYVPVIPLANGSHVALNQPLDIDQADFPDEVIDQAITHAKVTLSSVATSDEQVIARRRRGQARLRQLTLDNYEHSCALCDVDQDSLLVTSHIVRWADDPAARGDLSNIVCLCCFHDPLFEQGYIYLTDECRVRKRSCSNRTVALNLDLVTEFRMPKHFAPSPEYIRRHRLRTGNGA